MEDTVDGSRERGRIPVSASRPAPSYGYAGPPHQQEVGVAPGLLCLVADIAGKLPQPAISSQVPDSVSWEVGHDGHDQ